MPSDILSLHIDSLSLRAAVDATQFVAAIP